MTKITLKELRLINFKGVKQFNAAFNPFANEILGANAAGKTSVLDAFLWLFFNKNSEGKTDFEVKTLDENNQFIKDQETEVEAILEVDGVEMQIKKVLQQKWQRKRGSNETEYRGDESIYYWNGVPLKQTDFRVKVAGLIDENVFRQITNPFYFNSLKWQDRRAVLVELAGVTNDNVIAKIGANPQYVAIIKALNEGKSLEEYKKQVVSERLKIKADLERIPDRIDEVRRGMPAPIEFDKIAGEIKTLQARKEDLEQSLNNALSQVKLQQEKQAKLLAEYNSIVNNRDAGIAALNSKINRLTTEALEQAQHEKVSLEAKLKHYTSELNVVNTSISSYQNRIAELNNKIAENEKQIEDYRAKYVEIDGLQFQFDESNCTCNYCKQALPYGDIEKQREEMQAAFSSKKRTQLENLIHNANELKKLNEELKVNIETGTKIIAETQTKKADIVNQIEQIGGLLENLAGKDFTTIANELLDNNEDFIAAKIQLEQLHNVSIEKPIFEELPTVDNQETKQEIAAIDNQIAEKRAELSKQNQINSATDRIKELEQSQSLLASKQVEYEGIEFAILEFTKAKIAMIEDSINSRFQYVKFKMFDQHISGGESETCETLVNSNGAFVPYSDANFAAKVNAGLDIINALSDFHGVSAPIFIDNRESVTKVIDTKAQLISLIVSPRHKELTIQGADVFAAAI